MKFDYNSYKSFYTADFETSTKEWNEQIARVWLWDICSDTYNHKTGTTISSFFDFLFSRSRTGILYGFHNLAYDGMYIIDYLLKAGFKWVADSREVKNKQFSTCISDLGQHYAYTVKYNNIVVYFVDTLKFIHSSVRDIANIYNLPILKGDIDYNINRPVGYEPTEEEISYIHNDTEIVMRAMQIKIAGGEHKFTQAGNAKYEFKQSLNGEFDNLFPEIDLEEDKYLRRAYCGGYTYVNPKIACNDIECAISLDCNSMYPAQMLHEFMPYGYPVYFNGRYEKNEKYPIYVQRIRCIFKLKDDGIPTIARRRLYSSIGELYVESSDFRTVELTLASPDLELLFDNYDVWALEWIDGYMFKARKGHEVTEEEANDLEVDEIIEKDGVGSFFYSYFKKWRTIKEHSKGAVRLNAKLMQNGLYGVFSTNPIKRSAIPFLGEDEKVHFKLSEPKVEKGMYLPVGIFVTAWARYMIIKYIKKYKYRFLYCDTDSLYLKGQEIPTGIKIHSSLYGYFKIEHYIEKARFLGPKRYIFYGRESGEDNKWYISCCGADNSVKAQMNWDNFKPNAEFNGKKSVKTVVGGKHIETTTYKLLV